jgi:putative ABC transport system permease protein
MLRLLRLISWPQLRQSWGRTLLVVGGIATGVTLIVAIDIVNTSLVANLKDTIDLVAGPAGLEVTLGVGEVGFDEAIADSVRRDSDVAAAVPLVRGTIGLAGDPGETLQLFGADLTAERDLGRYGITTSDRAEILRRLADPRSILLTKRFAGRHDLMLGRSVRLTTPSGVEDFTLAAVLEVEGLAAAFGSQLAIMDLPAAQLALGKEGRIDQLDVVVREGADIDRLRARLREALPSVLNIERPSQRSAQYERILASFQAMLTGLSLLCLVAGIFIIYNTTSTGIVHRSRAMADLRLIGAEPGRLFRLLLFEATVLGTIGAIIGLGQGIVVARFLIGAVSDSVGVIFQLRLPVERLAVEVRNQAFIAMVGVAAALLASWLAARRVIRMDPLDVLRGDSLSSAGEVKPRRLAMWWMLMTAVSAAAIAMEVRSKSIAWGNFGSTLWNASVIVISIPLVCWSAGWLSRALTRAFGPEGRVAAHGLFRTPARTGVTAAAIALVLTIAITVAALSLSHQKSVAGYFSGGPLASDLSVSAVATDGGWLEMPLSEEIEGQLRAVPEVRRTETLRILPGQMYRDRRVALAALSDGLLDSTRYPRGWLREGDPLTAGLEVRAGRGAFISTSLSDWAALQVGDSIELPSPTGPVGLRVVGVVADYMSDRGAVVVARDVLAARWLDHQVNRVNVYVEPGSSPEDVRRSIAARLGERYRIKILSLGELIDYHVAAIKRAFALMDAIQLLVVIIAVAGVFDLLISSILERRRELALWRVIGADSRTVRRSIVIESMTIGAGAAVLAVIVGFVTAWIWVAFNFRYLLGYYLEFHFPVSTTLRVLCLALLATAVAGYTASARATKRPIVDGIRDE